jgi:hypothetical protein
MVILRFVTINLQVHLKMLWWKGKSRAGKKHMDMNGAQ